MRFGDKLKLWRKDHGMTQDELTRDIRMIANNPRHYCGLMSKWENGYGYPALLNLLAVSAITGLSLDYLLEEELEAVRKAYIKKINERRVS